MLKTQNYNNIIATFRFKGIATLHERKMSATKTAPPFKEVSEFISRF